MNETGRMCSYDCAVEKPYHKELLALRAKLFAAQSECERLRSDGKNVSRMIVMMAAEIAQARREPRITGPKVGIDDAPVSSDIIVEFHKRAEAALAAGEE